MSSLSRLALSASLLALVVVPPAAARSSSGKVVYQCGQNLCRVDGHGHHRHKLTSGGGQGAKQYTEPSLSRNGRRMVFQGPDSQAYTADGNARHQHKLTDGSLPTMLPEISPDGRKVLWTTSKSYAGTFTVVRNFDGSGEQQWQIPNGIAGFAPGGLLFCDVDPNALRVDPLPATSATDPCPHIVAADAADGAYFDWRPQFSPNGKLIVDAVGHDGGINNDGIVVYDAATAKLAAQLTSTKGDSAPVFSPDGKSVLFDRGDDIYKVKATGGAAKRFVRGGSHPTWSR